MDMNDIMISPKTTIRSALKQLDKSAKRALFVVQDNKLIGAVSDGDIRRWILNNGNLDKSVDKVMNTNPITLTKADKGTAFKKMISAGISAIPIVNRENEIETVLFLNEEEEETRTACLNADVVIMAGGKGERLLPYTSIVPKPLIPIGEKSIIELIIESFKNYGCSNYYVSLNYKKNMIKAFFDELERDYSVRYIEEDIPLGTGGSLFFLKDELKDTFFVSNCDILLDVEYDKVYRYHKENQNKITIISSLRHYTIPYGIIKLTDNGTVESLIEKPKTDYLINTGVYVLEPEVMGYLKENEFMHITEIIDQCLLDGLKVGTYPISEDSLMDMGQFEDMERMKLKLSKA